MVEGPGKTGPREPGALPQLTGRSMADHIVVFDAPERLVGAVVRARVTDAADRAELIDDNAARLQDVLDRTARPRPGNWPDASLREEVIDRLLASPQYGERWARHWLDFYWAYRYKFGCSCFIHIDPFEK